MTDPRRIDDGQPESGPAKIARTVATPESAPGSDENISTPAESAAGLTPEEQMALFEKELKENDWGHQPC